jgi:hypothetical protein
VSDPRKHHYVPVFYQKNFVNASGLLWVYDRRLRTYKELHPRVICFETDLYTLKKQGAPSDRRIESLALASVDGACATALRELVPGKMPADSSTFETIAYFAAIQHARGPSQRDFISMLYKNGIEELMRITAANVDRMKSVMEQYRRDTGKTIDVSPESMVEAVHENHLEVVVNERPFIHHMFKQAESLSKLFFEALVWEILVASAETGFILCDDPVVIVPPKGVADVGFLVPASVKYVPLTRILCLRLGDFGQTFRYRSVDSKTVSVINQNIAASSSRFIMGPVKEQLETIVLSSGSVDMDPRPRFTLETTEVTDDGSLQKITQNPRKYFYLDNATQAP